MPYPVDSQNPIRILRFQKLYRLVVSEDFRSWRLYEFIPSFVARRWIHALADSENIEHSTEGFSQDYKLGGIDRLLLGEQRVYVPF